MSLKVHGRVTTTKSDFQKGDIVLVETRFTDESDIKLRPALVVSNNKYNISSEDLLLVNISSSANDNELNIPINEENLSEGYLILKSKVKCDYIGLINKSIIKTKIAKVSKDFLDYITDTIIQIIK